MTDPNANAMAAALQRGGVGLMPTDTVYGLVCHPDHATGKPRIFELKQRPTALNLQVLLPEGLPPAAIGAVVIPAAEALLRRRELAAGITFILALDPVAKPGWLADREEVGVRVPGDPRAQAVLAQTGPLFATAPTPTASRRARPWRRSWRTLPARRTPFGMPAGSAARPRPS